MYEERPALQKVNYGWGAIFALVLFIAWLIYNVMFLVTSPNMTTLFAAIFVFFIVISALYFYTILSIKYIVRDNNLILTGFMMHLTIPIHNIIALKQAPRKPSELRKQLYQHPTRKFSTFNTNRWFLTWSEEGKTRQTLLNPSPELIRTIKRKRVKSGKGEGKKK